MINFTRAGIFIFALAVVSGPFYTVKEYSVISNLISELGAQQTQNSFIMNLAFFVLGAGILIDGLRKFKTTLLPFILFGLAMAVVGMYPHKPIDVSVDFDTTSHHLHGIIASVAGTVITIGFIWQGFRASGSHRMICFYMAMVAIVFPVLMLIFADFQGIIQRGMYLQLLGWLWIKYPGYAANESLPLTVKSDGNCI